MKKICFVTTDIKFFMSHRFDLARELSKKFEVSVICNFSNVKADNDELKKNNIAPIFLAKRNKKLDIIRYMFQLRKILRREKFHNIIFVTLEISSIGALLLRRLNSKVFFVISGIGHNLLKKNLVGLFLRKIQKLIFLSTIKNKNSFFVFQNKEDNNLFNRLFEIPEFKCHLIPGNGIDTKKFSFTSRNFKSKTFIYAGRLTKSKGIETLYIAFDKLVKKYPNKSILLNICGGFNNLDNDSISSSLLEKIIKHEKITYHREVSQDDLIDILSRSSFFVLPSEREGISRAALEAASTGLPIIASSNPGVRDVVIENKNGYIFSYNNETSLFAAMENLLFADRDKIYAFSQESSKMVESKYSLEAIVPMYQSILED